MSLAAVAPGRVRRALRLGELDAIHFPLSVMLPPVDSPPAATTVLDVQHEVFPQFFSRAELAYRRRVYGWTVRKSRIVITISEHARQALIERLGLDARARARDPPRRRPRALHAGRTPARAVPALSREPLAAQEPRSGCSRRSRSSGASGPSCGSSSPARATRAVPAGGGRVARPRLARRAGRAVPPRGCARLPEPVRGLRDALRRGDGLRLPGRLLARRLAPRGLRRRRRVLRPGVDVEDIARGIDQVLTGRRPAGSSGRRASPGTSAPAGTTTSIEARSVTGRRPRAQACGQIVALSLPIQCQTLGGKRHERRGAGQA